MKKLYIILIALLTVNGALAQWISLNSGTFFHLSDEFFTDANTGYAAGEAGTLLKTTNGGQSWTPLNTNTSSNLTSVHFPTPDTGYAVGSYGTILKTIDGGITWTSAIYNCGTGTMGMRDVFFTNSSTGFILGSCTSYWTGDQWSMVIKTTDGGATWTPVYGVGWSFFVKIFFTDADTGYLVGSQDTWITGLILKTVDGGNTWVNISPPSMPFIFSVFFMNPDTGYIATGILYRTIDGGTNWDALPGGMGITNIYFPNIDTGYSIGDAGKIIKTIDGGLTWDSLSSGTTSWLRSAFFINTDTGYVVGDNGTILKTTNGGGVPVGMNDKTKMSDCLKIYPNPGTDKITIETPEKSQKSDLSLYNLNGQEFLKQTISESKISINISNLNAGLYIVKVTGVRTVWVGKIVKE